MSYQGDIRLGETIDVKFSSRRFTTGAPFTLAGSPVISAYVGNGTTELTAGITLSVDFDGRTGLNNVRVVATAANGYARGTNVQLVITAGTIDSVSVVGEVIGSFSIDNRADDLVLYSGTITNADNSLIDLGTLGLANDELNDHLIVAFDNSTGEFHARWIDDLDGATSQVLLHAVLPFTTESGVDTFKVLVIRRDDNVLDIINTIGTAGAGLTNINLPNQTMDIVGNITGNLSGSVGSVTGAVGSVTAAVTLPAIPANWITPAGITDDAFTAAKFADAFIVAASFAAGAIDAAAMNVTGSEFTAIPWNAAWDAEVQSEVQDAIEVNHLDHLLAVDYDPASKPGVATALLNELIESDAGVSRFTANSLEQAPAGGGGSTDWTADERTAIRSILGIPGSGTTPADPTVGILDTIRDDGVATKAVTDNIARAAKCVTEGTVDTGATTTSIPTSALSPAAVAVDQFKAEIMAFPEDTTTTALRGQKTRITANTAAGVFTVEALTTAPVSGDLFVIE